MRTDGLELDILNDGQLSSDYSIATASSYYSTNTYVVGDASYTSPLRPANVFFQVDDVSYNSTSPAQSVSLVTAGSGLSAASNVSFTAIPAYSTLRKGVRNTSSNDPTCTFSGHSVHQSATGRALTTCTPLGAQVGDVVRIWCAQESLVTNASAVAGTVTISATGIGRGIPGNTTYTHGGVYTLVLGNHHVVLGGNYDGVLKVVEDASGNEILEMVEPGSGYYSGDTYFLSKPIRYAPFTGVVTQVPNAGGQFVDCDNGSNELFYSSLPNLQSSLSCVASRYSDGSVIRARLPSSLLDNGFGHCQSLKLKFAVRADFHMEDGYAEHELRVGSAHEVLGLGEAYVSAASNIIFPDNMNVLPVPYVLVCMRNLGPYIQTQITDDSHRGSSQDIIGKVIVGAPIATTKTSPMSLYFEKASIDEIDIEFRLPNNRDLYNFHGMEHTLTLSFVSQIP